MSNTNPHKPTLLQTLMELRAPVEAASLLLTLPLLRMAPKGDSHPVLVLPGFMATDNSTYVLRRFLRRQGFTPHSWGLGRNPGLQEAIYLQLEDRLITLHSENAEKVSIVGWSLGGIYARILAYHHPEKVRQVITLGSPFNLAHPTRTDDVAVSGPILKLYEKLNPGLHDDKLMNGAPVWEEIPPVPSTCIYSESDGIASWHYCIDEIGHETENLRISGSHTGMTHNPMILYAIAERLSQTHGGWKPFDSHWAHRALFLKSTCASASQVCA